MTRKKAIELQVRATTEAEISTDKCIIQTSSNNEDADAVKSGGTVKSEENDDKTDGKGLDMFSLVNDCDDVQVCENTNTKGKKKRKKMKNKKAKIVEKPNEQSVNVRRTNVKLAPLPKPAPKVDTTKPTPPDIHKGCLGFITSWLAKRKEKRREKKRQAIKARFSNSVKTKLTEYEHKNARGGVAFTLELDGRPINKPLLPPIQTKSGPIKLGCHEKLQKAEKKRQKQLTKRKEFARAQEEKRIENAERKADIERGFKQKAALTILSKQGQAKRNQSRLEMDRRCASSMRRATSFMTRVTSAASTDQDVDAFDNNFD